MVVIIILSAMAKEDVDNVIQVAKEAQRGWSQVPMSQRAGILQWP